MAEFLVFDKDHWMDKLTSENWKELNKRTHWEEKYSAHPKRGDIVDTRPDGFWTGPKARGFDHETFKVVCIPGLPVDPVIMKPRMQGRILLTRSPFHFSHTPDGKIVTMDTTDIKEK